MKSENVNMRIRDVGDGNATKIVNYIDAYDADGLARIFANASPEHRKAHANNVLIVNTGTGTIHNSLLNSAVKVIAPAKETQVLSAYNNARLMLTHATDLTGSLQDMPAYLYPQYRSLHPSAREHILDIIDRILEKSDNPSLTGALPKSPKDGSSLLESAINVNDIDLLRVFLRHGLIENIKGIIQENINSDIGEKLAEAGNRKGRNKKGVAVYKGFIVPLKNSKLLNELLELAPFKKEVLEQSLRAFQQINHSLSEPLITSAIKENDLESVKFLLEKAGATLNKGDYDITVSKNNRATMQALSKYLKPFEEQRVSSDPSLDFLAELEKEEVKSTKKKKKKRINQVEKTK